MGGIQTTAPRGVRLVAGRFGRRPHNRVPPCGGLPTAPPGSAGDAIPGLIPIAAGRATVAGARGAALPGPSLNQGRPAFRLTLRAFPPLARTTARTAAVTRAAVRALFAAGGKRRDNLIHHASERYPGLQSVIAHGAPSFLVDHRSEGATHELGQITHGRGHD